MRIAASAHGSWAAYGTALWAAIFALVHFVWAAGWYIGLDAEQARRAFSKPWFLAYDLAAGAMCCLAVAAALALVRPWRRRLPRLLIGLFAWGATVILALRGGAAIVLALYTATNRTTAARPVHFWDLWFCVGAVLFGVSAWKFWVGEVRDCIIATKPRSN